MLLGRQTRIARTTPSESEPTLTVVNFMTKQVVDSVSDLTADSDQSRLIRHNRIMQMSPEKRAVNMRAFAIGVNTMVTLHFLTESGLGDLGERFSEDLEAMQQNFSAEQWHDACLVAQARFQDEKNSIKDSVNQ
jgi:hypothetical protein